MSNHGWQADDEAEYSVHLEIALDVETHDPDYRRYPIPRIAFTRQKIESVMRNGERVEWRFIPDPIKKVIRERVSSMDPHAEFERSTIREP